MTSDWGLSRYHEATKHAPGRPSPGPRYLDWSNRPLPYKIYPTLEPIALPVEHAPSHLPALDAIRAAAGTPPRGGRLDLATLARLCHFSNGITRRRRYDGEEVAFRAAACTGALYHVELYLVCAKLPGLEAGVYHYGAHDDALRRLRRGDHRGVLVEATGTEPAVARAPLVVACTSTFWRNAWKYGPRAYRHAYWDTGTVLANLLAVAHAAGLPARTVLGFADGEVDRLLDVDGEREATIALVAVGEPVDPPPPAPPFGPLDLPTVPLSRREVDYPLIADAHRASALESGAEAAAWRASPGDPSPRQPAPAPEAGRRLSALPGAALPDPIEVVIRRRGSTRVFARDSITFEELSTLLDVATALLDIDCTGDYGPLGEPYLIVNAVEGLDPGAYAVRGGALEPLRTGRFRQAARALALDQDLGGDASVDVYFLTDLGRVLERYGERGYRLAQLSSAIMAGRLYLAAYALRLGATGLTFYDDEVTDFFSPDAAGKSVMFLLAAGHRRRRG